MILVIDIGNSYIKYKLWQNDQIITYGKIKSDEFDALQAKMEMFLINKTVFASVGSSDVVHKIQACLHCQSFEYAIATASCLGVKNGYEIPERLGVDRWLAVIEAYHLSGQKDCVVFDLGTALTVDIVTSDGRHLGGYIAPGLDVMREALQKTTQKVRYQSKNKASVDYGRNTADAVENGTLSMVIAWVQTEIYKFSRLYPYGEVYLTGGAAELVIPYLTTKIIFSPDLVLDGLKRVSLN